MECTSNPKGKVLVKTGQVLSSLAKVKVKVSMQMVKVKVKVGGPRKMFQL